MSSIKERISYALGCVETAIENTNDVDGDWDQLQVELERARNTLKALWDEAD
jgi:hypothetical protein